MSETPSALEIWQERLAYLQKEFAIASDSGHKFNLKKQIEECQQKIRELEEERQQKVKELEESAVSAIDWREVCRTMLEQQRRATSNFWLHDYEEAQQEREQIYVPLALVERKKPTKHKKGEVSPEEGAKLYEPEYEEKERFEHEAFLSRILQQGEGKTQGRRIALIGEPGAGKTTLLQTIAFWVLEQDLGLLIWISLAELGQREQLLDYLFKTWLPAAVRPTRLSEAKQQLEEQIVQGRVWLLLDGLDEVVASGMDAIRGVARQLQGWVGKARVVVTCRLNVWQGDSNALANCETFRLLNFSYPQQVEQFIERFFVGREKGKRLQEALAKPEQRRLQDLVRFPLRLTLLCYVWLAEEEQLPETKAGLYKRFVRQFYRWKQDKFPVTPQEQKRLNRFLGRIALKDIDSESSRFRLRESFLAEELEAPEFALGTQLGWLNKVGVAAEDSTDAVYGFYHATFEEYFAACAVEDWDYFLPRDHESCPVEGRRYRIFEPQWKEVVLLWLGREDVAKEEKEEFIDALVGFEDGLRYDFYGYRALFLAAAGIGEFKACRRAREVVDTLVQCGCFFKEATQEWETFPRRVEETAREARQESKRRDVISALINLLNTAQDYWTHREIAESLGKIGTDNLKALAVLIDMINNSQDYWTRGEVAESLGKIGADNLKALAVLIDIINTSQEDWIRREAVESLGKIGEGNLEAIASLSDIISAFQYEKIRRKAAESLGAMGEIGEGSPAVIALLIDMINISQKDWIRREAAESLGKIGKGNLEAIAVLIDLLKTSQSERTRRKAAESLGKIGAGNPEAITALIDLLKTSQSERTRRKAAESLGKIGAGNPEAITALIDIINTFQDKETSREALENFRKIGAGNPEVIAALINIINTFQDNGTHWKVIESLGKIMTLPYMPKVIKVLSSNLTDKTWKHDHGSFRKYYQVIWKCAQNLSYPDFYQAWHNPSSPRQLLNLVNFPQLLKEAANLPSSLPIICIDRTQFTSPDNPALDIYLEMVSQGCPSWQYGIPRTLTELKIYCKLDLNNNVVFIFTEDPSISNAQGFHPDFLNALSRFKNLICFISRRPPKASLSLLPTFSPYQTRPRRRSSFLVRDD